MQTYQLVAAGKVPDGTALELDLHMPVVAWRELLQEIQAVLPVGKRIGHRRWAECPNWQVREELAAETVRMLDHQRLERCLLS